MKTRKLLIVSLLILLFTLCFSAIVQAEDLIPYEKVKLNKKTITISTLGKAHLQLAKYVPANANYGEWVSSDTNVVNVDETGLVTPNASLMATASAKVSFVSAGNTLASCKVTVKVIPVKTIKLAKKTMAMAPGATFQMTAKVIPTNAAHATLNWETSNPAVVTVDQTGLLTAKNYGEAYITASTANGTKSTCLIKVKDILVEKVDIKKSTLQLQPNKTVQLSYSVLPVTASDTSLTWTSSNESVATVDQNGVVTTYYDGKTVITAVAKDGSKKKDSVKITVKAVRVKTFAFAQDYDEYLDVGDTLTLETVVTPSTASFKTPVWSSTNENVLTVDEDGKIKAVKGGAATIKATVDNGRMTISKRIYVRGGTPVSITISAVGDVTLGGDPRVSKDDYVVETNATLKRFKELMQQNNGDPGFVFYKVKEVFEKDDLTIANLEGPLCKSTRYSMTKRYVFKGYPSYAAALKSGSVEAVDLRNNKTVCCGNTGYEETKAAIETYCGDSTHWFENEPCYIEKKGVTIGLVGFQQGEDDAAKVKKTVTSMRENCDLLIVSFHWTKIDSGVRKTSTGMKKLAHAAIDCGADIVVGHHQHCLAGMEKYKGKTIAYGLGNFVAGGRGDRDTVILQQTFKVYDGFSEVGDVNVIPCCTLEDYSGDTQILNKWQPVLLEDETEKAALINRIRSYSRSYETPLLG